MTDPEWIPMDLDDFSCLALVAKTLHSRDRGTRPSDPVPAVPAVPSAVPLPLRLLGSKLKRGGCLVKHRVPAFLRGCLGTNTSTERECVNGGWIKLPEMRKTSSLATWEFAIAEYLHLAVLC